MGHADDPKLLLRRFVRQRHYEDNLDILMIFI